MPAKDEIRDVKDLPGIGPQAAEKLFSAGYKTLESVAVASPGELQEAAGLGDATSEKAIKAARDALEMGFETADILAERRKLVGRVTTGSKELDNLIGGGIESQSITEVYGKMASGKCVAKNTPLFYLNPDLPHLDSMEEVYEKYATNERPQDGGFLADLNHPISVIGVGLDGTIQNANAQHLFKEKVSELVEIKTNQGNTVQLTEQHPLLTLNENGIQWKSTGLLEEGDYIGTPAAISQNGTTQLTEDEAYFLGLFVAEGCSNPLSITIFDEKTLNWLQAFIRQRFGYEARIVPKKHLIIFQKPTREWMGKLAHTNSYTKFVPERVLQSNDSAIKAFLRGYIDGDGEANKVIATSTRSKQLNTQLSYLFARMGIQVSQRIRTVTGKPHYLTYVTDTQSKQKVKEILQKSHLKPNTTLNPENSGTHDGIPTKPIDSIIKRAYHQLSGSRRRTNQWSKKEFLGGKYNTVWLSFFATKRKSMGTSEETLRKITGFFDQRLKEMGETYEWLKNPTPANVKKSLTILPFQTADIRKKMGLKRSTFQNYMTRHLSKEKAVEIASVLRKMVEERVSNPSLTQDTKTLKMLETGTIKWEKIASKQKVPYNDWVYDLTVPGIHSFIGGEKPIFLHNTQWCFQTAVTVQKPVEEGGLAGNCLYIDSENSFRPERIVSIAEANGMNPEKVLKNIYVARAYNADHQMLLAEKAGEMIKEKNIKLMIVDSLTAQFRSEFIGRGQLADRQQRLNKHMRVLQRLAEMNNVAVLVTNQVMERPDILFGDPTAPIGGNVVGHASKTRLYLRKGKENKRIAKLVDSPSLPDGEAVYAVTERGIEDTEE